MTEEVKNEELKKEDLTSDPTENQPPQFIGLEKTEDKDTPKEEEVPLRDLLEKNLKWSQIIYEQNRRISRRLLWSLVLSWIKWVVIIVLLVLGTWFAWPITKNLFNQYEAITGSGASSGQKLDQSTLDKILKMIPLNDSEKEQIKAMNN